jgi:GNAT superfamily N-acetyltransferase
MTDPVDLSVRQFDDAWRVMCEGGPRYENIEADGVHYIFSGCPIPFFNVAFPTGRNITGDALKSRARQACAWASTREVPWLFLVTYEALEPGTDAASLLDGCGLAIALPMTGMLAQKVRPAANVPAGLELTVPQDDAACAAILDVNSLAYGMDLEAGKAVIGTRAFWTTHFPVLGLAGGKPACSAAVLMIGGYRYVALVATDPAQQRRGYAEAAMRRALELAREAHGEQPTVLHATDAGRPIYERMGYVPISTHTLFMEKRFLGDH